MKLLVSTTEYNAILYCPEVLVQEKCAVSILYESPPSEWSVGMCMSAFKQQRQWEIYRAYKDLNIKAFVEVLYYEPEDVERLAAYLQIKHVVGGYSELWYPKELSIVCKAIRGNLKLKEYNEVCGAYNSETQGLVEKALSRFKTIEI